VPSIGLAALALVAAVTAVVSPGTGAASKPASLDWKLERPTSHGTTVVGTLPGHGATRHLGVSVRGGKAVAIAGVEPVSVLARPHVGTDANGGIVVVYPRCATTDGARCDLYQVGVDGRGEQPVPGVNTPGSSELQGSMDRGDVAFLRSAHDLRAEHASLYLRPAGGEARLLSRAGGSEIALSGDHVAQVRDVDPYVGICGLPAVEVRDVDSGDVRHVIGRACGLNGQRLGSLNFAGGRLTFLAWDGADGVPGTKIYRTAEDGTGTTHTDGPRRAVAFAPTGPRTGVAVVLRGREGPTAMVAVRKLAFRGH